MSAAGPGPPNKRTPLKTITAATAIAIALAPTAHAAPITGGDGLTPNAWAIVTYIQNHYPNVQSIGGVRPDYLPDHPTGHAIDIMCGNNTGLCNTIANDIRSQSSRFGVAYILWQTAGHHDHIHVTVN